MIEFWKQQQSVTSLWTHINSLQLLITHFKECLAHYSDYSAGFEKECERALYPNI